MTSTPLLQCAGHAEACATTEYRGPPGPSSRPRSVPGQGPSGVFQDVVVEHTPPDVGKISRDVLVHAGVFSQIVESGLRPVVAAYHGVLLVPGEDVVVVPEREVGSRLDLSAFEHHGEILAIQRLQRFDPEEPEYRRRDVVCGGVVVARRPRSLTLWMADEKRDVRDLGPECGGELTDDAVFPMSDAVVGEGDEEGAVEEVELFHLIQKASEPAVHHRHLARVEGTHPPDLPPAQVVGAPVDRCERLGAVVTLIVHIYVLIRRVPWRVRIVAVHRKEERTLRCGGLQELGGPGEDLRGEPVLFRSAVRRIGEVPLEVRSAPRSQNGFVHQRLLDLPGRASIEWPVAVCGLSPDKIEGFEAALEVHRGVVLLQVVGNEQRLVARASHSLSEGDLVVRDRLPALKTDVYALVTSPVLERPGPEARVYGPPRADRWRGLGVSPTKAQALLCEGVQVGGLDLLVAVGADVILPQAVHDDQHHVGSPVRGRGIAWEVREYARTSAPGEQRCPGYPSARHLQELSSR